MLGITAGSRSKNCALLLPYPNDFVWFLFELAALASIARPNEPLCLCWGICIRWQLVIDCGIFFTDGHRLTATAAAATPVHISAYNNSNSCSRNNIDDDGFQRLVQRLHAVAGNDRLRLGRPRVRDVHQRGVISFFRASTPHLHAGPGRRALLRPRVRPRGWRHLFQVSVLLYTSCWGRNHIKIPHNFFYAKKIKHSDWFKTITWPY